MEGKKDKMKLAGLTGGIGSGKSTVARILAELGAYIIDADELARKVVEPGMPAWNEIRKVFGEDVINPDQTIDRKKLADVIFKNKKRRKQLEAITHPRIGEEIIKELDRAKKSGKKLAVIDAALLLESSLEKWVKPVIVVSADEGIRVERVCRRDGVSPEDVLARIRNQASDEERKKKADYLIENNGDLNELRARVFEIYKRIIQE